MVSDADRIRLAVAFCALKFKPPDQSFASYVLDLRSRFPSSIPSAPTADGSWRTHALLLERDHAELQGKYEAERIKNLELSASVASAAAPNTASEQNSSSISKKKAKKKTLVSVAGSRPLPSCRLDLKSVLEGLHDQMDFPTIPGPDSLIFAINNFLQLTSLPNIEPTLLLSVTVRAIEAIAKVLRSTISRSTPNIISQISTLETLSILLYHVLTIVLPLFPLVSGVPVINSQGSVNTLLDRITALVFNPLIRAFAHLSQIYYSFLFLPPSAGTSSATNPTHEGDLRPGSSSDRTSPRKPHPTDIRAGALSLFRATFGAIDTQIQLMLGISPAMHLSLHTLRASLILETIRELERLLSSVHSADPPHGPGGGVDNMEVEYNQKAQRVNRLATKDTLWYLCSVLHLLFGDSSGPAPYPMTVSVMHENNKDGYDEKEDEASEAEGQKDVQGGSGAERLLSEGISAALFKLVTRCKRTASGSRHDQTQIRDTSHHGHPTGGNNVFGTDEQARVGGEQSRQDGSSRLQGQGGNRNLGEGCPTSEYVYGEGPAHVPLQDPGDGDVDVGVIAGGRLLHRGGSGQGTASEPLSDVDLPTTSLLKKGTDGGTFDLDEIGYAMLLGVVERYCVWSESNFF